MTMALSVFIHACNMCSFPASCLCDAIDCRGRDDSHSHNPDHAWEWVTRNQSAFVDLELLHHSNTNNRWWAMIQTGALLRHQNNDNTFPHPVAHNSSKCAPKCCAWHKQKQTNTRNQTWKRRLNTHGRGFSSWVSHDVGEPSAITGTIAETTYRTRTILFNSPGTWCIHSTTLKRSTSISTVCVECWCALVVLALWNEIEKPPWKNGVHRRLTKIRLRERDPRRSDLRRRGVAKINNQDTLSRRAAQHIEKNTKFFFFKKNRFNLGAP